MSKIFTMLASFLGLKALKIIIVSFFVVIVLSFYSFMINAIILAYNLDKQLFDFLSSSSVGSDSYNIVYNLYAVLDAMGFMDAVNAIMPTIMSAVVFVLSKVLYKATVSAYKAVTTSAIVALS